MPLTPEEVDRLSQPAVQQAIERINASLIQGERTFVVAPGLAPFVAMTLRSFGWKVGPIRQTIMIDNEGPEPNVELFTIVSSQ